MQENKLYKKLFFALILIVGLVCIYAILSDETPRIVLFLGRFHPLLLHLPIGALLVAFFIDILGRFQKKYPVETVKNILGFTAFSAILTSFLGYFLSLEGGYNVQTLDLHFYTGILTAVLTTVLFLLSLKEAFNTNKLFLYLFVLTLISVSVAGHFGSVLTHGDNFLTEYARAPEKEKTIEVVDSLRLYSNVVTKILDKKCVQCHNSSKMKGELSLISKSQILKGGAGGTPVSKGNASASILYTRLLLPISDEEHMPPEGKAQLTKDEIWLIKHWIDTGLDFENYVQNTAKNDTLKEALKKYLVFNNLEIPKASKSTIEALRTSGFRVLEVVPNEAALSVKYLDTTPNKEAIAKLSKLKEQIIELNFGDVEITNEMTNVIKKLKNLKTLRINSPKITDDAVGNFKNLEQLEVLNIYKTDISNSGLTALLKTISPKQIYSGQTQVDKETANTLASKFDINIQNNIKDGFIEASTLEMPELTPSASLFKDSLYITAESRLKDVSLHYTLNGDTPDTSSAIFKDSILLKTSKTLKIVALKKGWLPSETLVRDYSKVAHQVQGFTMAKKPDERYAKADKLFDLEEGSLSFKDDQWTGCFGFDLNTTVDLGSVKPVEHISFNCLEDVGSWILYPTDFIVYTSDTKNGSFKKAGAVKITRTGQGGNSEKKRITLNLPEASARYFKILIKTHKQLPKWHPAAGNPAWVFVDEIYFW